MSILDKKNDELLKRIAGNAFLAALFCWLFGTVYEQFSFEVYSPYMLLAFLWPLCGGSLPALLFLVCAKRFMPGSLPRQLWMGGLAWFTAGSFVKGVLEIYGTTNRLTAVYPVIGILLLGAAAAFYLVRIIRP